VGTQQQSEIMEFCAEFMWLFIGEDFVSKMC